jgi:hypothetical protein
MVVESAPRPRQQPHPDSGAAEPPEALIEEARSWQRRRRIRLVVAAIAIAAVAGGAYAGFADQAAKPPTIPLIERNVATALTKSKTTLMVRLLRYRTNTPYAPVYQTEWVDFATGRKRTLDYDAAHRLTAETSFSYVSNAPYTGSHTRQVTVAYDSKTWSLSAPSGEACRLVGEHPCVTPAVATCGCDLDPFTDYRAFSVSLLGRQTVGGRPSFHLRFVVPGRWPSTIEFWVDRSTYLPVSTSIVHRVPRGNGQVGLGPAMTTTDDFTWLPRRKANLAQLTVVVPRSFERSTSQ